MMEFRWLSLLHLMALAVAAGCYTGSPVDVNDPVVSADGTEPPPDEGDDNHDHDHADPKDKTTGLPCDVSKVLLASCAECHGAHPDPGAPRLLTWQDLAAQRGHGSTQTIAELALVRMRGPYMPMPPDESVDPGDIEVFEKWIRAGLPRGSCGDETSDAGSDGKAPNPDLESAPGKGISP